MTTRIPLLDQFFHSYADLFNQALRSDEPDIGGIQQSFSSCFIAANPMGVNCGHNDEEFMRAMLQGFTFYKSVGVTTMEIISLESSILDDFHQMTKIFWRCKYTTKKDSTGSIEFENIYFTQTRDGKHRIFAYITGDEQAAWKNVGQI